MIFLFFLFSLNFDRNLKIAEIDGTDSVIMEEGFEHLRVSLLFLVFVLISVEPEPNFLVWSRFWAFLGFYSLLFKGKVQRDFRPPVFFIIQICLGH